MIKTRTGRVYAKLIPPVLEEFLLYPVSYRTKGVRGLGRDESVPLGSGGVVGGHQVYVEKTGQEDGVENRRDCPHVRVPRKSKGLEGLLG